MVPDLSDDDVVVRDGELDVVHHHDARDMGAVASSSVALVVTSPPYFAGKEYEEDLGKNGVPGTYFEYLALLRAVFEECKRVLEPGGRIAVNVANLGRRPYRSLAGDVAGILQDCGLLLRGEIVWWKGRAAGGSCAWGTFQRPGNPVLRDVTERIVVASKGRFDRALPASERQRRNLPSVATISRDEFLQATTDLWDIPPESATRVGHPAPFPVALPRRLIDLYTYEGDVVLDPFMGSGTTGVAAVQAGRHFVGFDTDRSYVEAARARVTKAREDAARPDASPAARVRLPAVSGFAADEDPRTRAVREGRQARDLARVVLEECGFTTIGTDVRVPGLGVSLDFVASDAAGHEWAFDVSGTFASGRTGLGRNDTLWRVLGRAAVVHHHRPDLPLVLLTTDLPRTGSTGHRALLTLTGDGLPVADVVELLDAPGHDRLRAHARRGRP